MYTRFWGFREKPFQQLPNPEFLFLSATHEEALAHLNYALSEGEGFLMITGEVGTGKSTLCRSFLQNLDADIACAYIFNSKLDPIQLLRSINAEFDIAADADTSTELIDVLNAFLIDNSSNEHKVVIVIDEAQNLPVDSLEQVRLLSNLETTREKLLHLVLVGQPELADMIDSFALRQLGQRIQLACHLHPLTFQETVQYIQHRINLVSEKPQMPFDKGALRVIYGFSKGVPRLINTACDRMLLAAYLRKRTRITASLASGIIAELLQRGRRPESTFPMAQVAIAVALIIVSAIVVGVFFVDGSVPYLSAMVPKQLSAAHQVAVRKPWPEKQPEIGINIKPVIGFPEQKNDPQTKASHQKNNRPFRNAMPLEEWLRSIQHLDTRSLALEAVLQQWGLEPKGDMALSEMGDAAFFDIVAERHGLSVLTIEDEIDPLVVLDLPAVITLYGGENDRPLYAGLISINDDGFFELMIRGQNAKAWIDALTMMRLWGGKAYIPWKNYMGYEGIIPIGTPLSAVIPLKQLLWEMGYADLIIDDRYDEKTRNAVREVQAKYGLKVDGLVGDMTKIVLFNQKRSLPIPRLSHWSTADNKMD